MMEKQVIGYKTELNIGLAMLMIFGGIVLAVGGILFFLFVLAGAVGGAVAGGLIGGGGYMVIAGIMSITLPVELVYINNDTVYVNNKPIGFHQIREASAKSNRLIITKTDGKKIAQGYMKNAAECAERISAELNSRKSN